MRAKRILSAVLGTVLLISLLGGCGSGAVENTDSNAKNTEGTKNAEGEDSRKEASAQTAEGGKEIDFFMNMGDEITTQLIEEQIAKYEQESGNKVNLSVMEEEAYKTKIKTCMAANSLPDVFGYWIGEQFHTLVESGNVKDLTEELNQDTAYRDSFIGGVFDAVTIDDKIYGMPSGVSGQVLFYNKRIFSDCGIEAAPATLEELEAACEKIKEAGFVPIVAGAKDRWPLLGWYSYLAVREGGMELYKEVTDGNSDKKFTEPAFVKAGTIMKDLSEAYFINGSLAIAADSAAAQFAAGQAAMFVGGTWNIADFKANEETLNDIGFCSFPVIEGGYETQANTVYGGITNCYAISSSSDVAPEAYALIQQILSVEAETERAEKTGGLSCMKIEPNKENMVPIAFEISEFFNHSVAGFFPYTDQALNPEQAENLLNAMTTIIAGGDVNVEEELAKIK